MSGCKYEKLTHMWWEVQTIHSKTVTIQEVNWLTDWLHGTVSEELRVTHSVKFFAFYGTLDSLLCSKDLSTGPYPEQDASILHLHTLFLKAPFQ
jgi:hypothetical protein